MQFKPALFLLAAALCAASVQATPIAQWDYNSGSTKHAFSMNGASFSTLGSVTTAFVSGSGSTDPAGTNNALNTTTYGSATTGNLTRGVQYMIDTSGYEDVVFSFDQRNSATASAWTALLYTLDGDTWTQATSFKMPVDSAFVKGINYSFADITGADNNPFFGVELVSMFAPGSSAYAATKSGSSYASTGTIRYDMVTLSGTEIAEAPVVDVPEPGSLATLMAGLGCMALVARRRQR